MVIKGGARGGPRQLANHLLRTDHNEVVNVLHMHGIDAPDLYSALREMHLIGRGAQSKRTLYHANIDPRADERLTKEQNHIAVERLAARLGFSDQPYVVVEHVKAGRHHLHVVWSRIDLESMTAIPDSHNFPKHEEVARDLERQFGHERVQGAHHERDGVERPKRTDDFADRQKAARAGTTPKEQKQIVTACWRETTTGEEFRQRLEAAGFILARGDRRDLVLVDCAGAVYGLARRIEGANAAEVRERMSDIVRDELPDVKEARARLQLQASRAIPLPEKSPEFESAVDRMRKEELKKRATQLGNTNGDIADAIFHLNKTMRGQMEQTISTASVAEQQKVKAMVRDAVAEMAKAAQAQPSATPMPEKPVERYVVPRMVDALQQAEQKQITPAKAHAVEQRTGNGGPSGQNNDDTNARQIRRDNARKNLVGLERYIEQAKQGTMHTPSGRNNGPLREAPPTVQPQRETLSQKLDRLKAERQAEQQRDGVARLKKENERPQRSQFQRQRTFE